METIHKIESVAQFNRERGQKTLHPLVSVLDQSLSSLVHEARYRSELYIVFLKDTKCEELKYGRNHYDYEEGTLSSLHPIKYLALKVAERCYSHPAGHWYFILT